MLINPLEKLRPPTVYCQVSTPTRGVSTPRIRTTGGEYFHEFEYEDWEEVDITKPIPIWICLLLVFGILFGGRYVSTNAKNTRIF